MRRETSYFVGYHETIRVFRQRIAELLFYFGRAPRIQSDHTRLVPLAVERYLRDSLHEQFTQKTLDAFGFNTRDEFSQFVEKRIDSQVAVIGAGTMGSALIRSWIRLGLRPEAIVAIEPRPSDNLSELVHDSRISIMPSVQTLHAATVLFLAVKPQEANNLLPQLSRLVGNNTLIVSIMAGRTTSGIERQVKPESISPNVPVVRAMPNLPATIGRGITAAFRNTAVSAIQYQLADALLAATGGVVWVDDERQMDAVTAVSGSGPAYVFYLTECLTRAGKTAGLPDDVASRLARATVSGAGELLDFSTIDAEILRQNVTSPGGTTEAALKVLTAPDGFELMVERAVLAAVRRSKELAG